MNRRKLFQTIGGLLLGGTVATRLKPKISSWSIVPNARDIFLVRPVITDAISFLDRHYKNYVSLTGKQPRTIRVSAAMFEQYESELHVNQQFVDNTGCNGLYGLKFRMATVMVNPAFVDVECWLSLAEPKELIESQIV